MEINKMKYKLSQEEQEIEKNADQFVEISKSEKKEIDDLINKAGTKKAITLRLNTNDLEKIKFEADKSGMPYQTLINSILHKYVTDQLVDEKVFQKLKEIVSH